MDDYSWITEEMFDRKLRQIVVDDNDHAGGLLGVHGVYEIVREYYNNSVIAELENERGQ